MAWHSSTMLAISQLKHVIRRKFRQSKRFYQVTHFSSVIMACSTKYNVLLLFFFSGFAFLSILGTLFRLQPQFIRSCTNKKNASALCFQASGLYAFCTVVLYCYVRRDHLGIGRMRWKGANRKKRFGYYDMDDSDAHIPLTKEFSPAFAESTLPSVYSTSSSIHHRKKSRGFEM